MKSSPQANLRCYERGLVAIFDSANAVSTRTATLAAVTIRVLSQDEIIVQPYWSHASPVVAIIERRKFGSSAIIFG